MNDIVNNDIETYLRNLVSEGFGRRPEDIQSRDDPPQEDACADPAFGPVKAAPIPNDEKDAAEEDGGMEVRPGTNVRDKE